MPEDRMPEEEVKIKVKMGINVRLVDTHLYCCILEDDPNNRERKCMSIQR